MQILFGLYSVEFNAKSKMMLVVNIFWIWCFNTAKTVRTKSCFFFKHSVSIWKLRMWIVGILKPDFTRPAVFVVFCGRQIWTAGRPVWYLHCISTKPHRCCDQIVAWHWLVGNKKRSPSFQRTLSNLDSSDQTKPHSVLWIFWIVWYCKFCLWAP